MFIYTEYNTSENGNEFSGMNLFIITMHLSDTFTNLLIIQCDRYLFHCLFVCFCFLVRKTRLVIHVTLCFWHHGSRDINVLTAATSTNILSSIHQSVSFMKTYFENYHYSIKIFKRVLYCVVVMLLLLLIIHLFCWICFGTIGGCILNIYWSIIGKENNRTVMSWTQYFGGCCWC